MIAKLLYLIGMIMLVADTKQWGISAVAMLVIWIAATADSHNCDC